MLEKLRTKRDELYQDFIRVEPGPLGSNIRTHRDIQESYREYKVMNNIVEAIEEV